MGTRRDSLVPESNCDWDYCEIPFAGAAPDDMIQKIEDENNPQILNGLSMTAIAPLGLGNKEVLRRYCA